jgi:hypothetical protein
MVLQDVVISYLTTESQALKIYAREKGVKDQPTIRSHSGT